MTEIVPVAHSTIVVLKPGILAIDYKDTSPADVKKVTGQDFVKAI